MIIGQNGNQPPPDGRYHRKFVPANQARRDPPPQYTKQSQTMAVICPKCAASFRTPTGAQVAFCRSPDPPYFGPKRGCGWLLAIHPPAYETSDKASVDAVQDCLKNWDPQRGDFVIGDWRALFARVYERWERRGYGKVHVREDGSLDFVRKAASGLAELGAQYDAPKERQA